MLELRLHKIRVSALFGLLTVAMLLLLRIVVKLWPRTYKSKDLVDDMHWHIYHVSQLKVHAYTLAARFVVAKHCHGMQSTTVLLEYILLFQQ